MSAHRAPLAITITLCLALGLVLTEASSSRAVSGMSADGSAARAQYNPDRDQGCGTNQSGKPGDPGGQVRTICSAGELPFTGSASLLILGLGGVLFVTGAVLRRRTMRGHDI